jgi:hypothetical protein
VLGFVAVLKVYMDESGVYDDLPVVTVAAYLGRPGEWREWTKRWNGAKRPIKVFHAADAQKLHGEFEGWSEEDRDEFVKRVVPIIADTGFPGIVIGVHMAEFRRAMAGHGDLAPFFGTPYAACFHWVVQTLMYLQARTGNRERIVFVHENNDYQHEVLESFNYIKSRANPNRISLGILFGDKASHPPLQAADILAYEGNKRMRDPHRPERQPWRLLNPYRRIVSAQYGRHNIPQLIANLRRIKAGQPVEFSDKNWIRDLMGKKQLAAAS